MDKKTKSVKQSLEDLKQGLGQLELNLQAAHTKGDKQVIKDIERSIAMTKLIIKRLTSGR